MKQKQETFFKSKYWRVAALFSKEINYRFAKLLI